MFTTHRLLATAYQMDSIGHMKTDLQDLDCDFYVFSGHKVFAPTGIGVLYAKQGILETMPPYQGGGDMIKKVSFEGVTFCDIPERFEAGTPHIAGAIGLAAALKYLDNIGYDNIHNHEEKLLQYATRELVRIPGVIIYGTSANKVAVISFTMKDVHPHDIATILDSKNIAIRAGQHCAMPLMKYLGVHATARISLAFYNTKQEIDSLVASLKEVYAMFH